MSVNGLASLTDSVICVLISERPGKGPADLHPGAPQPGTPRRGHSPGEGGSARTAADEARRSPSEIRAPAHSKLTGI